jgi:hypothetical protein
MAEIESFGFSVKRIKESLADAGLTRLSLDTLLDRTYVRTVAPYLQKLFLRKLFVHLDGRKVLAYEHVEDGWFVEARPAASLGPRRRWYPKDEDDAAAVVFWLLGKCEGWTEERVWVP